MGTCKDCKHWDPLSKAIEESGGSKAPFPVGECKCDKIRGDNWGYLRKTYDRNVLFYEQRYYDAGEEYGLWAITGPDFGCIHFEKFGTLTP